MGTEELTPFVCTRRDGRVHTRTCNRRSDGMMSFVHVSFCTCCRFEHDRLHEQYRRLLLFMRIQQLQTFLLRLTGFLHGVAQ